MRPSLFLAIAPNIPFGGSTPCGRPYMSAAPITLTSCTYRSRSSSSQRKYSSALSCSPEGLLNSASIGSESAIGLYNPYFCCQTQAKGFQLVGLDGFEPSTCTL